MKAMVHRVATTFGTSPPVETVDFGTTNTVTRNFVGARGIEAIFTTTPTSDTTTYPLYDAHGNMTSTLSKAGNSYVNGDVRTYDVWGGIRSGATTAGPNNRYCASLGHVQDDESGLVYMRARYYEPGTGRFICEDEEGQGANWFLYANSNPVLNVDPSGHFPISAIAAFLIAFGLFIASTGFLATAQFCADPLVKAFCNWMSAVCTSLSGLMIIDGAAILPNPASMYLAVGSFIATMIVALISFMQLKIWMELLSDEGIDIPSFRDNRTYIGGKFGGIAKTREDE